MQTPKIQESTDSPPFDLDRTMREYDVLKELRRIEIEDWRDALRRRQLEAGR